MKKLSIAIIFILLATQGHTDSVSTNERILRLEATVEELTFKLAKSLAENKRLASALKQAMSANREGQRIVEGCDTAELDLLYAYNGSTALNKFILDNVKSCTREQVVEIYNTFGKGGKNVTNSRSNRLLEYYVKN